MRQLLALAVAATPLAAQQTENFDYWNHSRQLIQHGVQSVLMCNGLFTSNRTLEQVFEQELRYLRSPVGTPSGGDYEINRELRSVRVGGAGTVPGITSIFRDGIGCVVMAPDQPRAALDSLPRLGAVPLPGDPDTIPWPMGDMLSELPLPQGIDPDALEAASDWAFERDTPEQQTLSLIVVHRGRIVLERYAPGVTMDTRTRTWSTAKSIAVTLIGMAVDDGLMTLDGPLKFPWLPRTRGDTPDPRDSITLRHLLNMSSGLYPVDNARMEYATGSGLSYWAGASAVQGALDRGLIREPGTNWDYENYDTILAVYALKLALGDEHAYHEFPRRMLLDRIGMRNTLLSTDRFGDFILSSQVYTNARDLARFGILYQQNGIWNGERLLSEEWIDFVRTPAPATVGRGSFYGGQWWLVPDGRNDVPRDAYSTAGNRGQFVVVVPSHELVIVRRGLDYGRQGFSQWDLTREVLKAFE